MFYTSNLKTINLETIDENTVAGVSIKESSFGSYYHLQAPFVLQFATYHADSADQRLLFTSMSPDRIIYSSTSASEIQQHLSDRLHQHDFYELLFVIEGSLYQNIENRRHLYIPGSCCLLNKNVRHKEEYSSDFRVVFFQLSDRFIQDLFAAFSLDYFQAEREHTQTQMERFLQQNISQSESMGKNYIDFIPTQDAAWVVQNVHSIFEQITFELLSPQFGSSSFILGLFFKLFHLLDQPKFYHTTPVKIGTDPENRLFHDITTQMEQTGGRASRSDLEANLHFSGDYLNKIVKKYTGLSIFDYGMTFCMKKAASLLLHSSMTVTEIALQLGFSNRTHFYKVFQDTYNMTPAAYRKSHRSMP